MKNYRQKQWFHSWSNEYDKTLGRISRHLEMLDLTVKMADVHSNDRILDIGCGTGLLSLKFLKENSCHLTCIDNAASMLAIWKNKIKKLGLQDRTTCLLMDATDLNFSKNTFDIVASTVALHHCKNKQKTINRIYSILKPGGRFVIGDLDLDTSGSIYDRKRLTNIMDYLKEELSLALNDGGVKAFSRMYDNGKKHIMNDGEYCISFSQWAKLCKNAGFKDISIEAIKSFKWIKVLIGEKND